VTARDRSSLADAVPDKASATIAIDDEAQAERGEKPLSLAPFAGRY
jgi:hypothetical protein